jgi:tetratricopeptide (TPR) repeat protein
MKNLLMRFFAFALVAFLAASPVFATCGGGGGGGGGGTSGSSGSGGASTIVYHVPWELRKPDAAAISSGLIVYWFPANVEEIKKSPLKESRPLSQYAGQCVSMQLADNRLANAEKLIGESKLPVVVLANPDGSAVGRVENKDGKLKLAEVEKLVGDEFKKRESDVETSLKDAKAKNAAGDKDAAINLYKAVAAEKCMFPKKAKDAEKELKKLGAANIGDTMLPVPNFDPRVSAQIVSLMKQGLKAENSARYLTADKFYTQAHKLDPADPTPLRYLGELYRHHIGDWVKARVMFDKILAMPFADPLSKAVALHGLGKMTIHDGEFKKGLSLMEQSAVAYPLALTYRNLAVYWNSEYDFRKGNEYTEKALALDPKDPYNLVFAAVFMAMAGKKDEALKIAQANAHLLPASYNLAAIYAQNGRKTEALAFLKRHFFTYERYQAVREKEMMEARVDAVFDSIRDDKDFMALTSGADGKLPMPMSPKQAEGTKMEH